jgi:hypothetical protein
LPEKDQIIKRPVPNKPMQKAFKWTAGKSFKWEKGEWEIEESFLKI